MSHWVDCVEYGKKYVCELLYCTFHVTYKVPSAHRLSTPGWSRCNIALTVTELVELRYVPSDAVSAQSLVSPCSPLTRKLFINEAADLGT